MTVPCSYCPRELDPDSKLVYRRVRGWERKAISTTRRSGSDIVLREHDEEFACSGCIDKLKAGVSLEQGSLL